MKKTLKGSYKVCEKLCKNSKCLNPRRTCVQKKLQYVNIEKRQLRKLLQVICVSHVDLITFLSQHNNFCEMYQILWRWCVVSSGGSLSTRHTLWQSQTSVSGCGTESNRGRRRKLPQLKAVIIISSNFPNFHI